MPSSKLDEQVKLVRPMGVLVQPMEELDGQRVLVLRVERLGELVRPMGRPRECALLSKWRLGG